jgi:hypothetical protein
MPEFEELAERRKLAWRAIFAGAVATLGLGVFFLLLGGSLRLTVFSMPASHTLTAGFYLLITALFSIFVGSWITGHWANLYAAEDAWVHGGIMWALVAIAFAVIVVLQGEWVTSRAGQAAQATQPEARPPSPERNESPEGSESKSMFSALNDKSFANFLAEHARAYGNKLERQPISVSAEDKAARIDPKNIPNDYELQRFVMAEGNMNEAQAREFLNSEREDIAKAQADSQRAWEQSHARELAQAENARHHVTIFAWTMTILAFLTLALSLAGAHLGWRQRYVNFEEEEQIAAEKSPDMPDLRGDI